MRLEIVPASFYKIFHEVAHRFPLNSDGQLTVKSDLRGDQALFINCSHYASHLMVAESFTVPKTAAVQHFIHMIFCQNIKNKNTTQPWPSVLAMVFAVFSSSTLSWGNPFKNITSIPGQIIAGMKAILTMNYY